jgi:ribonuclease HII
MSANRKKMKSSELYAFDFLIAQEMHLKIVGVDEVGRGPLAGPVVSAAVCLDLNEVIDGINDSKKLSAAERERLYDIIIEKSICWSVASASPEEIDKINILQASLLSMKRALEKIQQNWEYILIDGNQLIPGIDKVKQRTIVQGDAKSASIAAASIIAKVTRDKLMSEYHEKYPIYEFNENKGYATEHHRNSISEHGICEIHRKTFCETFINYQTSLPL